jgi:hypothetical protein
MKTSHALLLISLVNIGASTISAIAQDSAFTYQGYLTDGSKAASGNYDLRFRLFNAATTGNQIGNTLTSAPVVVSNGVFSVPVDFGAAAFDGNPRWLEIAVRSNGSQFAHSLITPRQAIRSTPYAVRAGGASGLLGNPIITGIVTFNPNSGPPFAVGSSTKVGGLNADFLDGLDSSAFASGGHGHDGIYWKLLGNAATTAGVNFLGTTDNQPLELKANNQRVLRLEPTSGGPNLLGGFSGNSTYAGSIGVTIGGGGGVGALNSISIPIAGMTANFATIGGGASNSVGAGSHATIAGGHANQIHYEARTPGHYSAIGGGTGNEVIDATRSTIAGGANNEILGSFVGLQSSTIGGGSLNRVRDSDYAFLGGGTGNYIDNGARGTIGGGESNRLGGLCGWGTVGGGRLNTNYARGGTIGGGSGNYVGGDCDFGFGNVYATIGGGSGNFIAQSFSSAGGGTIAGGLFNWVLTRVNSDTCAAIGGGCSNVVQGTFGTVPGGLNNAATNYAFAAGRRAKAIHVGSFVWADSQDADFSSSTSNQVSFRCLGGVRFTSGAGGASQTVSWTPGSAAWSFTSDRETKEGLAPVNSRQILEKVARLPIREWNYKGYTQRHIGPMAQDFHGAFRLNDNDTSLNTADLHGVTLSAVQGLHQIVTEQQTELVAKDRRIRVLEKRLADLEQVVMTLVARPVQQAP